MGHLSDVCAGMFSGGYTELGYCREVHYGSESAGKSDSDCNY